MSDDLAKQIVDATAKQILEDLDELGKQGLNTRNPAAVAAYASGNIENFLVAATPGGIEAQEAAGQRMLVSREMLPNKCYNVTREQMEALGFTFGKDVDDLFVEATLPDGWSKQAAPDHSMWSYLYDEKGRKRASIFYKAAFYDRRTDMTFECRYQNEYWAGESDTEPDWNSDTVRFAVTDCRKPIFFTDSVNGRTNWQAEDVIDKQAKAYLEANYPDYRDPLAYWD